MRISLKADYAIRGMAEIAAAQGSGPVKAETIGTNQGIPHKFLLNILSELRRADLVRSRRGGAGGYLLAREAAGITLADIIRAVEGPLANVHEQRPEQVTYVGASRALREVWIAVRVNLRQVLEAVTLDDLVNARLPPGVLELTRQRDALVSR